MDKLSTIGFLYKIVLLLYPISVGDIKNHLPLLVSAGGMQTDRLNLLSNQSIFLPAPLKVLKDTFFTYD
jgi:hypothetical protein